MANQLRTFTMYAGRINGRHLRLLLVILSLAMFVIGAGAPADGGGWDGG